MARPSSSSFLIISAALNDALLTKYDVVTTPATPRAVKISGELLLISFRPFVKSVDIDMFVYHFLISRTKIQSNHTPSVRTTMIKSKMKLRHPYLSESHLHTY